MAANPWPSTRQALALNQQTTCHYELAAPARLDNGSARCNVESLLDNPTPLGRNPLATRTAMAVTAMLPVSLQTAATDPPSFAKSPAPEPAHHCPTRHVHAGARRFRYKAHQGVRRAVNYVRAVHHRCVNSAHQGRAWRDLLGHWFLHRQRAD